MIRAEQRARVQLLHAAAERMTGRHDLVEPLVAHTGLSRAGVELALRNYVRWDPHEEDLAGLTAMPLPHTEHATLILAANVFVAVVRAVLVAAVCSERVSLRASRREPVFAPAFVEVARDLGADWLDLDESRELGTLRGAVHVYGRAETVRAVRRGVPAGVAVYAHGPGYSAAWVPSAHPDLDEAARRLADDVVPFDQRGCLSPRIAFVEGESRALTLAAALDRELAQREQQVPRGLLDQTERADWARYLDTWTMAARAVHESQRHVVVVAAAEAPLAIAPTGRAMHVVAAPSETHVLAALERLAPQLTALAFDHGALPRGAMPTVKRCALGRLQKQPMDGPADLRALTCSG